jgi:hypothetical protein
MNSPDTSNDAGVSDLPSVGWREWVALPELGIPRVKAKIDTGARTSALHAEDFLNVTIDGGPGLEFTVRPEQGADARPIRCSAPLIDRREVRSSSGEAGLRPVILTLATIGGVTFPLELTLTARDRMGFRMLIGRTALRRRFVVDPGRSFLQSSPPAKSKPTP